VTQVIEVLRQLHGEGQQDNTKMATAELTGSKGTEEGDIESHESDPDTDIDTGVPSEVWREAAFAIRSSAAHLLSNVHGLQHGVHVHGALSDDEGASASDREQDHEQEQEQAEGATRTMLELDLDLESLTMQSNRKLRVLLG